MASGACRDALGVGQGSQSTPAVRPYRRRQAASTTDSEGLAPCRSTVRRRGHGDNNPAPADTRAHGRRGGDPRSPRARRPADSGSSHHRAGLAAARQGLVCGPQPRHAGGGAPVQWRPLQDGRPAAVHRGRARQLEGAAHRPQRPGRGDGAGAPGRAPVVGGPDPAGNRQLPRDRDRPPGRLATGSPAAQGAGVAAAGRAAGLRPHPRGHPQGLLRDLRRRGFLDAAALPGSRSRPRAGDPRKERTMKIEYFHASKFGNGAMVAEEFTKQMAAKGVTVNVQHIRAARPDRLPTADLYLFSSPGRMGKPIGGMRRFLKKLRLPAGSRYAILTTEAAPQPDKRNGRIPTEDELAKWQRVRPIMNEILQGAGLVKVAEDKVLVTGLKGPLEEGWQKKVEAFAARVPLEMQGADNGHEPAQAVLPTR